MKHLITVLALATLSIACSSSSEDSKEADKEVADAVHQPLEKAKGVEQQIFENAAKQRRQVDDL